MNAHIIFPEDKHANVNAVIVVRRKESVQVVLRDMEGDAKGWCWLTPEEAVEIGGALVDLGMRQQEAE